MDLPFESIDPLAEGFKKSAVILHIPEDLSPFDSTGQHVLKSIGVVHLEGSGCKWIILL